MSLRGKVAVVTGSASGIGLGIARALARDGADILLNGFGAPDEIEELQGSLSRNHNVRVTYSDADMSKPSAIAQMIDRATQELGEVDVLVNNAGIQFTAPYVAAKHGVIGFTKVVARETARSGVTCNAICPGWVLTPLVEKQIADRAKGEKVSIDEAKIELLAEKQPSQEFATPEQLGALAVFLCSDAAAQMRGAALPVDGGWLAQ